MPPPLRPAAFQRDLLAWFTTAQRDLPWRRTPSAYATVVSEFMLQQTQVKTVLPYFARWLEAFPDFAALAAAPESRVLRAWEGLGYYSRARNLHRLAQAVSQRPTLPRTAADWQTLPGIGPYTSAAIASIAFGEPVACVDGNVVRILARIHADDTLWRDSATAAKACTARAEALLNREQPGAHNQAMMELGATVCTRANPRCEACPVRRHCGAARTEDPTRFPRLAAKTITEVAVDRLWSLTAQGLLLRRGDAKARRLAHLHELPSKEDLGWTRLPPGAEILAVKKRSITRFRYTETIWQVRDLAPSNMATLVRIPVADLDEVTLSGPHRRWVEELLRVAPALRQSAFPLDPA